MKVTILKDIHHPSFNDPFWARSSRIIYDAKPPISRKMHQLLYQQGERFGTPGDRCEYLSHEELILLEQNGYVRVKRER